MNRILKSCLLFLLLPVALSAQSHEEKQLERRARRFYTYYYLNHYDDMWGVFHSSLRAKLGDDRKAYVAGLRASDLELHEAKIKKVEVRDEKGRVDVELIFFFRQVGQPIPRRHRMYWAREEGKWRYLGSELLEQTSPLPGEVEEGKVAGQPSKRVDPSLADAGDRSLERPGGDPPIPEEDSRPLPPLVPRGKPSSGAAEEGTSVAAVEPKPAEPSGITDVPGAGPSGLPEDLSIESEPEGTGKSGDALVDHLVGLGFIRREAKLREVANRLGPEDLPALVRASSLADFPIREWCVAQVGRMGKKYPELRESAASALLDMISSPVDNGLRAKAATAIDPYREASAREPLEDLLLEGNDAQQIAAARALASLADPRSVPFLHATWKRSRSDEVRPVLVAALSVIRDEEATSLLIDLARDRSVADRERMQALRGIARSAPSSLRADIEALQSDLADSEEDGLPAGEALLILAALYRLDPQRTMPAVESLLSDPPEEEPSSEGRLLGRFLAAEEDLSTARRLLDSGSPAVRFPGAVAVTEMAHAGVTGAEDLLREVAAEEPSPTVRQTMEQALRRLASQESRR